MEVLIRNLDSQTTKDELLHLLTPALETLHIRVFDVRKKKNKTVAQLTIADTSKAQKLLAYAETNRSFFCSPSGKQAYFCISKWSPHPMLLRALRKAESTSDVQPVWHQQTAPQQKTSVDKAESEGLEILSVECGRWEISDGSNTFVPYYLLEGGGSIARKGQTLVIKMNPGISERHDLVFEILSIQSLSLSLIGESRSLTITSVLAPKIYKEEGLSDPLARALSMLNIGNAYGDKPKQYRACYLPESGPIITGTCLTYRLTFRQNSVDLEKRIQKMVSRPLPLSKTPKLIGRPPVVAMTGQISELNTQVALQRWSFAIKFQIQALWANALLSPGEVREMLPAIDSMFARSGEVVLTKVLQRLVLQLPFPDARTVPKYGGSKGAVAMMSQQRDHLLYANEAQRPKRDEVSVHRVTVTPTGLYLYGPEEFAANRVLRQYRAHQDCFLRVLFADEDEERISFDVGFSNEKVFRERFLSVLRNGLDIAGEHFDFLGFSHSSLRSQTCWFMRPFVYQGNPLSAKNLINQLGDFSVFRCPAKCAARIGQAFSETTSAVRIDASTVETFPDIENNGYTFTDGCGTMSQSTRKLLKGNSSREKQPTSYQVRYKGVKGMLTLDSRLQGHQIRLRKSMVKFKGSPSNDVEICGTNARPLSFKLNRQIIKILEDLDVPDQVFESLQEQAIQSLRFSTHSASTAINFLSLHLSDSSSGLPSLLKSLNAFGIQVTEDDFIRDVLGALIQVQLREIKYRSRILVPKARTLYGISDETGWLEEGQVFVTFDSWESKDPGHLNGRVAVTRSPALHPGDIQVVQAVSPPTDSCLWDLRNCVVFSQKGQRDLPSMLSGGDLDGDLYNVIFDEDLIPQRTEPPAMYPKANPVDIERIVTSDDIAEFFVKFMENDQLGRIATLHQVFADDPDDDGTKSSNCLLLAELHSTAVDFSKSGVSANITKIPRSSRWRPDFMAPSASTKVERGIRRSGEPAEPEDDQRYRYYESDRILGKLYRATDENAFFNELEDDRSSIFSTDPTNSVLKEILDWVLGRISRNSILTSVELANKVRGFYESNLLEIMSQYAVHRTDYLTEKEVFIGSIIGRSGKGSKYQREQSEGMKSRFNRDLRDIKSWMRAETSDDHMKFMSLSAACLYLAVEGSSDNAKLSSFGWFAAAICVPGLTKHDEMISM